MKTVPEKEQYLKKKGKFFNDGVGRCFKYNKTKYYWMKCETYIEFLDRCLKQVNPQPKREE